MSSIFKIKASDLPESWEIATVGSVLRTSSGGTPSTTHKEYWQNGTIAWINSGALKDEKIEIPTTFISELGLSNSSAKIFPINTVVIALTGSTTGKVGLLNIPCASNQSIVGIYPSSYLEPKFLFYYFIAIRGQIFAQAIGSAQPHINKGIIDETEIPIAPIAHQRKIVTQLEKILDKVDNINKQIKEIETLEDDALNSFIYNHDELYLGIKIGDCCKQRVDRIGKNWKGKKLIGVSKDIGIVDLRTYGKASYEKYKVVQPGDFIYNPMRVDIGSIAIWDGTEAALTSPDYVVFYVEHTIAPLLLLKFLKSHVGLSQINNNTQGSVRSRLYFKNLAQMELPLNDSELQSEAQTIFEGFKKMKDECFAVQNSLKNIIDDTFRRAFKGELIGEEPFQDTGNKLITMMVAEKENYSKQKKKKVKTLKMRKTLNKVNIVEYISKVFGKEKFTFDKLYNKSGVEYETLKKDLYQIIDKKIVLEFDTTNEIMYFKLK